MNPYQTPKTKYSADSSNQRSNVNKGVIKCPQCEKPLVNIGSSVQRIHPVPRFIQDRHSHILLVSYIITTVLFLSGIFGIGRFIGFAIVSTYLFIPFVLYITVRLFKVYRVTDCPYCGYRDEQAIGKSSTS